MLISNRAAAQRDDFLSAFRCVQAWLLEKPAAWADADAASLAAALMVQRPPARAREDALLQVERYRLRIAGLCGELRAETARGEEREREKIILRRQLERSYDLGERNLAELQMVREHAALFEEEGNRETWRREELERRVEILEEENRNLRRRTH